MESRTITVTRVICEKSDWAACEATADGKTFSTYSGRIIQPVVGMKYKVDCTETKHPKYGLQYRVDSCKICEEQSDGGIINYLAKADIRGIGLKTAKKIVDRFGSETIDVIRNDWMRLCEIDGISQKKATTIHEGEIKRAPLLDLLGFEGITFSKATAIYEKYGDEATKIVKEDTYRLIYDIDGIGFASADKIALKNGADPLGEKRIAAAITFCLVSAGENGHCYDSKDDLVKQLSDDTMKIFPGISQERFDEILQNECGNGHIVYEDGKYYARKMYTTEVNLAANICYLANASVPAPDDSIVSETIRRIENEASKKFGIDFRYEPDQIEAIRMGLSNRLSLITGGAGTGKTTIIKTIATAFEAMNPDGQVILCAPTGKAAKRMEESTGFPASTIHRMLRSGKGTAGSLLVCDESSMLDVNLAEMLVKYITETNLRCVFVGDVNQLPPIGPGMFFRDLLNCPHIRKVALQMCHRQQGNIAINADLVNRGFNPKALIYDNVTTRRVHAESIEATDCVLKEYKRMIARYGIENVCIITPLRKATRSKTAAGRLNPMIRDIVNPRPPKPGCRFAIGDRIINLKNEKQEDIYNGDVGVVTECDADKNEFDVEIDGIVHSFPLGKQEDFDWAYAMTVHKSQGSEYAGIIFCLNMDAVYMSERNLVYTAFTRAKKELVVVGDTKALAIAISHNTAIQRRSCMLDRINQTF